MEMVRVQQDSVHYLSIIRLTFIPFIVVRTMYFLPFLFFSTLKTNYFFARLQRG